MEQQMVGNENWDFGTVYPPFVVSFRVTERNGTTHGGRLVENWNCVTVCPPFVVPFRFTEQNGTTNGGQLVEH